MHDQDQGSLGQLLFLRRIQVYRKDLSHGRTYPPAGPEGFRPPYHNQAPTEIGHVAAEHFLLLIREVSAAGIDQYDRICAHQHG